MIDIIIISNPSIEGDPNQDPADAFLLPENDPHDDLRTIEEHDPFLSDAEADADALASAGMGTDEDYGCYGGGED